MRVLWISCLLMGSVSCVPVQKGRGSQAGPYDGPEVAQAVPEWSNYYQTPAEETWVSGSAAAVDEPVFSDVSDLEPLFSISSRSRYQRGRAVFAQSRYTPIYSVLPAEPEYRQDTKTPAWSGPKAPAKYGY